MRLDPDHLAILAAIVDAGGLGEGAALVGRSQPSVSRTVALLETRVGEPLFERGRRPLRPTELGALLAAQGRRILEASRLAGGVLDQYRAGRSGLVRVSGTPFFMDGVVAREIGAFQKENPDVRIELAYGYWDDLRQRLADGLLDVAICPLRRSGTPPGLRSTRLLVGRNVIACRRGHPLLAKRNLALADIAGQAWIAPPPGSPLGNDLRTVVAGIGIPDQRIAFSGGTLNSVLAMVSESDALTVLPYSVVFSLRRLYPIEPLKIRIEHPERDLCLVMPAGSPGSPAVRRFERFVARAFETIAATIDHAERRALWQGPE